MDKIQGISKAVILMDKHLHEELLIKDGIIQDKKLWENTYIYHQIERRKNNDNFSIGNHIRAMVYSMLSSGISWERVESGIDITTGKILPIDEIFHQYDIQFILKSKPDDLAEKIKALGCSSQSTRKQMKALIYTNIPKMLTIQEEYGSIDVFYRKFIDIDSSLKTLVLILSSSDSIFKYSEMGEALIAEYLKNIGYEIAKPDRHIRRILGGEYLACTKNKTVPVYETIDIVAEIAKELEKSAAEVDYILWSYCAKGYGEICTVNYSKCNDCIVKENCKKGVFQNGSKI